MPKTTAKKAAPRAAAKSKVAKKAAPKSKGVSKSRAPAKAAAKKAAPKAAAKKSSVKKAPPKKKTTAKQSTAKTSAPKKQVAAAKSSVKKTVKQTSTKPSTSAKPKSRKSVLEPTDVLSMGETPIAPYKEKRGESYMSEAQIEHFRNILNTWKHTLMQEVDHTVHHMQDDASNFPDPNDRASQESEFTIELRTRDRERKLIKKIEESLGLLDSGDYGYCETCGVEIGIRRLEARPTATQCIDCKTLDEIKEKQMGR